MRKLERDRDQEYKASLDIEALDAAQNSLNVRAVGSDDTRTNAERAEAFLEQSRSANAGDADLRNAVALEAYVERKLRHDFGDNRALVERGVNAARHKIADLIRHGAEISPPAVVDKRSKTQRSEMRDRSRSAPSAIRNARDDDDWSTRSSA